MKAFLVYLKSGSVIEMYVNHKNTFNFFEGVLLLQQDGYSIFYGDDGKTMVRINEIVAITEKEEDQPEKRAGFDL
jgi:hypothetical protein